MCDPPDPARDSFAIGLAPIEFKTEGVDDMTDTSPAPGAIRHIARTTLFLTAVLLAGCSSQQQAGQAGSKLRVYATDMAGGAKICVAPKIVPSPAATTEVTMGLSNDGGWCGVRVDQDGAKPFDAGLLTARPAHGSVTIHSVGDDTRIDYTPDRGFSGNDSFRVKLIPGNETVHVTVAVSPVATATASKP